MDAMTNKVLRRFSDENSLVRDVATANATANAIANEENLSLRDMSAAIFRRKRLILAAVLMIMIFTTAITLLTPNQYKSRMKILVKNARADVVVTSERTSSGVASNLVTEAQINSEIELLMSRDLLEQVVKSTFVNRKTLSEQALAELTPSQLEQSVHQLESKLSATPIKKSNIIEISYTAESPEAAAEVLERLAHLYMEKHLKLHSPPGAYEFFQKQAADYETQLLDAEGEMTNFRRNMDVVILDQQKELNLRKMADLKSDVLESSVSLNETTERIAGIEQQLRLLDPRVMTESRVLPQHNLIERLKTMLMEVQSRRTQLLTKFQPEEREVKEADQQIKDITIALADAKQETAVEQSSGLNPLRQNLESELAKAKLEQAQHQSRRQSLTTQVDQYQAQLGKLVGATGVHDDLARRVKASEDNYQLYAKKRDEALIANALDEQKIMNVAIAEAPTVAHQPTTPNRRMNLAVGSTYGEPEQVPISEDHPQRPTNPYGWSKFFMGRMVETCDQAYGFKFVALRYFNAAGCTETLGEHHDPETHLIPNVLAAAEGSLPYVSINRA